MSINATNYSLKDVERWLGAREVQKGRGYLKAVSKLEVGEDEITASVQGTARKPYLAAIHFVPAPNGQMRLSAQCSCPVGHFCKHTAAILLKALAEREKPVAVRPAVLGWIEELRRLSDKPSPRPSKASRKTQHLFYTLEGPDYRGLHSVQCYKGRADEDGLPVGDFDHWNNFERALTAPPKFVDETDLGILRLLWMQRPRDRFGSDLYINGNQANEILQRLLASGRWLNTIKQRLPIHESAPRKGRLTWQKDHLGNIRPLPVLEPAADTVLPLDPPWYVDSARGEAGLLQIDLPASLVHQLLVSPALNESEARLVGAALAEVAPDLPSPLGTQTPTRVLETTLVPTLRIASVPVNGITPFRRYDNGWSLKTLDVAVPGLRYGDFRFDPQDHRAFLLTPEGETVRIRRDPAEETRRLQSLAQFGFEPIPPHATYYGQNTLPQPAFGLESEQAWLYFMDDILPRLQDAGWEVELPENFRHHYLEVESWEAEFSEGESGWFNLDMGIVVDGRRLPLAPLLSALFNQDGRWLDPIRLPDIAEDERIDLSTPEGLRLRVPAGRLKPLARTLIDLFDRGVPEGGRLTFSKLDALRLSELDSMQRWQFRGLDAIQHLAEKLRNSLGVTPVEPPPGFALDLRTYQKEGLAWLQYLREQELAGILADDMGLGKTAQTLAHLLTEKTAGRLDLPALVVLPTSLIFNWKREAERFAPDLRVLSLHGKDRAERFHEIPDCDIALTTYPLLWRDHEILQQQKWHMLILDEAQTVKNAASKGASVVRKLNTRHRLCLTGTPLENHLGELWAQFDFLLPGFLGSSKDFTKHWRTPVEKHGNTLRRDLLARRLKPFILRRKKEDVARELPPKTIILRTVELEGSQRDLYETVRSAMDVKVREAVALQGFNRSHIVILDALLKLRQVCCDPRLVKIESAKRVKERAKLDLLMDMLPELVDEGRRILLFSQFTTMLDLIQDELKKLNLPYVLLTGDTSDRETPIRRFQAGEAPIFLISLKAGGIGLNLTAADTVIHYDPWWNPAVENQATDRAHRLGQTKPVFVYKLICAGSIEEKILALQEKKAELAAGILSEDRAGDVKFSEADLAALLAPLPEK